MSMKIGRKAEGGGRKAEGGGRKGEGGEGGYDRSRRIAKPQAAATAVSPSPLRPLAASPPPPSAFRLPPLHLPRLGAIIKVPTMNTNLQGV